MSELADETDSKSVVLTGVWVRVPLPAGIYSWNLFLGFQLFFCSMDKVLLQQNGKVMMLVPYCALI